MEAILKGWENEDWTTNGKRQKLAYGLLTECLAYQYVLRWLE